MVSWRDVAFDSLSDYGRHRILRTFAEPSEEAMADITILNFDKDGALVGELPVVGPEITDVVLIAHGWNEGPESALGHYQDLVDPLEVILSHNKTQWQGHTVAYFGVIWPSAKYADDLTVINMRADVGDPPPAGDRCGLTYSPVFERCGFWKHVLGTWRSFSGLIPTCSLLRRFGRLATTAPATLSCRRFRTPPPIVVNSRADEQTKAEYDAAFSDTGSDLFSAIDRELQQLSTNVADVVADNPLIGWLKQLRGDANAKIAYILNLFAYNEMKIRAGVVGGGLADHVLNPLLADRKRVHLVGHSFGGRLMTAATAAAEGARSAI